MEKTEFLPPVTPELRVCNARISCICSLLVGAARRWIGSRIRASASSRTVPGPKLLQAALFASRSCTGGTRI